MAKYEITSVEGEYQPGSNGKVLKNLLDITEVEDINDVETALLLKLYEYVFDDNNQLDGNLDIKTISEWHRKWLGNVYQWAANYV